MPKKMVEGNRKGELYYIINKGYLPKMKEMEHESIKELLVKDIIEP